MCARANESALTSHTSTQSFLVNMPTTLHVWLCLLSTGILWALEVTHW